MMRYIFSVAQNFTKKDLTNIIKKIETTTPEGSEVMMTLAEILRQEGMEIGIEKGMEIGEAKALTNTTILLLTGKFGALPRDIKDDITKADVPTLQFILSNIFTIQTIDEVRRYVH